MREIKKNNEKIEKSLEKEFLNINVSIQKGQQFYNSIINNVDLNQLLYIQEFDIQRYIINDINSNKFTVKLLKKDIDNTTYTYWINIYKVNTKKITRSKKSKNIRNIYKKKMLNKYINTIGIINSQIAHAQDIEVNEFTPLRSFLNSNKEEFKQKELYIKDYNNNMKVLRHKNLFSVYKDEISDFEKITFFKRDEQKKLILFHSLDEKILDYDQSSETLIDRKNARELAKEIYHKKGVFTDKELLKSLNSQNAFIKVQKTLSAQNKIVWSKVTKDDMNINILYKEVKNYYKSNPEREKNIQLKYLSKRNKKRKLRREQKKYVKEGLEEYYLNIH